MTSTLHERLQRLADQVDPTTDPTAGPELWRRGRRYQRLRRTGTALVACVAVAAATIVGTVAWQRSAPPPQPVPADAPVGLPSRIHEPSAWLPGTAEAGPPGRLVALLPAERGGWWGSRPGVVGVSATTGEYRFLDLPGASPGWTALAPDGSHVAYWLTGTPSGSPNTEWHDDTLVGVAVYDTATGEVERKLIETEHGLSANSIAWVDSDTLAVHHGQIMGGDDGTEMEQSQSAHAPVLRWDLGESTLHPWSELEGAQPHAWGPSAGGRAITIAGENRLQVLGAPLPGGRPEQMPYGGGLGGMDGSMALDPTGTRIASVWGGNGKSPNKVVVATLPTRPGDVLRYDLLPGSGLTFDVEGWIDEERVAVTRRSGPLRDGMGAGIYAVDAQTGASSEIVALPDGWFRHVTWATDLLDAPVVGRPAPPDPLDPRWTAAWLVVIGVGAVAGIRGWRRRVRP